MELHKAIKEIVVSKGPEMINNIQIINYLLDYQAFKKNPATKQILRDVINSRYAEKIISLDPKDLSWQMSFRKYQREFVDSFGYNDYLVEIVFDSIAYGLGINCSINKPNTKVNVNPDPFSNNPLKIGLLDILNSDEYKNATMELPLALGQTDSGFIFMEDLTILPHILVAGATGMGKSVCLNVIISSLIKKKKPDELKLILIDPKQVELSLYDRIEKQFLTHLEGLPPIATTIEDAKKTLDAVIRLIDSRYTMMKDARVRNIQEFNKPGVKKLPYCVVVIDEFGSLFLQDKMNFEYTICQIAQKGRAVGVHMIISTQHLISKIVSNNIKVVFSTRIVFRTPTGKESRVILDRVGAEKLARKGDMLFFSELGTTHIQCAFISTDEVNVMCRELADEYADAEETFLPSGSSPAEQKFLVKECDLEKYFKFHLCQGLKVPGTVGCGAIYNDEFRQLQMMGVASKTLGADNNFTMLVRDRDEVLRMIEDYYKVLDVEPKYLVKKNELVEFVNCYLTIGSASKIKNTMGTSYSKKPEFRQLQKMGIVSTKLDHILEPPDYCLPKQIYFVLVKDYDKIIKIIEEYYSDYKSK